MTDVDLNVVVAVVTVVVTGVVVVVVLVVVHGDPYDLKIVAFNEVDPRNHYTISEAGVTHCRRIGKAEVAEFTPLPQWEKECGLFHKVMDIPFFRRYSSWKAYTSWRGAIQADKFQACSQVLTSNLFVLNDTFQPSLLKVRELCVSLSQTKLHQIIPGSMYSLEEFVRDGRFGYG